MPTSFPTLPTWTAGAIVTKAQMDTLNEALTFLRNPPTCVVYHSINQSIPNNTLTSLAFNTERIDPWAMHDGGSNTRITIPSGGDGVYMITANISWAAQSASRLVQIILNGSTQLANQEILLGSSKALGQSIGRLYRLAAGDYVEVKVLQDSGVSLNVEVVANLSPEFSVAWVGTGL